MKDDLRRAGAEKVVQDLILGHASSSVGERYGGEAARLEVAHRAMKAALSLRVDAVGRVTKASTGESV
ncbi:hypothetical protein [Rhodobacter aestuarii]|nr:hypothetical protein [Rhodobacter aestuarii]